MVRFGIVGAGNIARKFAQDITAVTDAEVTAVASRSLEKAQAFADEYNIPHAFEGYKEMAKSDKIDAVYIATPHNFHKDHSIIFLEQKKHVLCEKPIAVNNKELTEMIMVAKKHNVLLMEAMWTRYLPAVRELDTLLQARKFGNLLSMNISFGFDIISGKNESNRLLNPNLAGGSLLDLGVYFASFFRFVTNDPIKDMKTSVIMSDTNVDLMTTVDLILDNPQQTTVHLECAEDRFLDNTAVLVFEEGTIYVPQFWSATSLIVNGEEHQFPHLLGGFEFEIEHFVQTLKEGLLEDSIMTHQDSIDVMKLLDAIRSSINLVFPFEQ